MDRFKKMESELLATKLSEQKFVETKFNFGEKIENLLQMNSIVGNNAQKYWRLNMVLQTMTQRRVS